MTSVDANVTKTSSSSRKGKIAAVVVGLSVFWSIAGWVANAVSEAESVAEEAGQALGLLQQDAHERQQATTTCR